MKKFELYWTYEIVNFHVGGEDEHEIFLTFHPEKVKGSYPFKLTEVHIRKWFWPKIFDYTNLRDVGQSLSDVIASLDGMDHFKDSRGNRLKRALCKMLNETYLAELVVPLENQAYKEWQEAVKNN